jgi:hypothetical protein
LRINGKIVKSIDFSLPSIVGSFRVIVGEQANGDQSFIGEISLVQVFDRSFTDEDFSEMLVDCPTFSRRPPEGVVIGWTKYTTVDQYNYAGLLSSF